MHPKFKSSALQAAADKTATDVDGFTATLDSISEDIKALEKWLQQSGVRVEVEVEIATEETDLTPPGSLVVIVEEVHLRRRIEAVAWAPLPETDTWRIVHRVYWRDGFIEHPPQITWTDPEDVTARALIETPVNVRLAVAESDALAKLLTAVHSRIPQTTKDIVVQGVLRLTEYLDGEDGVTDGFGLTFVPAGGSAEGRPEKTYGDNAADLLGDLRSLRSPEVDQVIGPGWAFHGFEVQCAVSFRALRRLGLVG